MHAIFHRKTNSSDRMMKSISPVLTRFIPGNGGVGVIIPDFRLHFVVEDFATWHVPGDIDFHLPHIARHVRLFAASFQH